MLVLSRKKNESVMIGDQIVVTVTGIQGDKVRLGIQAPRNLPVHRNEVITKIEESGPTWQEIDIDDVVK